MGPGESLDVEAHDRAVASTDVCVESDADAWTDYVRTHPDATGYHDWAWRDVFVRAFGCQPIYLSARRGSRIAGVLPTVFMDSWLFGRALISLPYLNYGGVLADDPATEMLLFRHAVEAARTRRCRHVELRHV